MMSVRGTENGPAVGGPDRHVPVMLREVLHHLAPSPNTVMIDGTFGAGGYSRALLEAGSTVLAIDRDRDAVAAAGAIGDQYGDRFAIVEGVFSRLDEYAVEAGYERVDGVVLDIGVSSMQLDTPERGFSFRHDGPLDMRMASTGRTAGDIVNTYSEADIAHLIFIYGEDRKSRAIARAIVRSRNEHPIRTTGDLADLVAKAIGRSTDKIHPATRTFQALRIAVNDELNELVDALGAAERILCDGGRLVVVTFHSLEDRIVKRFLRDRSKTSGGGSRHLPETDTPEPTFRLEERAARTPGAAETRRNPRARSAKLRFAIRTGGAARPLTAAELGVQGLLRTNGGGR